MRDGVVLEGDLYRPTGPAPWPVLLARTPYERRSRFPPMRWQMDALREAGFAVLVQDMRGRGDSGGTARAFDVARERRDTVDTLDWIVRQSWAREGVGMFGASYCGYLQWVAASTGHPALRAIVPLDTSALLDHWLLDQGVLRAGWVLPWLAAFGSGAEPGPR